MIKFVAGKDGKPLLGFGLSEGNIEKLRQGLPIVVDLDEMVRVEGQVVIFYAATDEALVDLVQPLMTPDVDIKEQKQYHEG